MSTIGLALGTVLLLFQIVLVARMVVDWVGVLAGGPEAPWHRTARLLTHALTEPVLAPVRRVLPTPRIGGVGIDLAFTVVFLGVLLLRQLVVGL